MFREHDLKTSVLSAEVKWTFAHVKVRRKKDIRTFGRYSRPSKPHWTHLSNYGTKVIELTTNHIYKRKTNVEAKWIRRKRVELGSDYKLRQSEYLGSHNRVVVHDPDCGRQF